MNRKSSGVLAFACALILCLGLAGCASGAASSESVASGSSADGTSAASVSSGADAGVGSAASLDAASSEAASGAATATAPLANGTYIAQVDTDSSMFHVNEAKEGTGELTVTDEGMVVHLVLNSKKIINLYAGTAAEAKEDPAGVIQPTTDKVTYSDGIEEEVYGFDVPVPALDEPFDVAILGSKGTWYDHKVTVSNPVSA